jgi:hypothetical protein
MSELLRVAAAQAGAFSTTQAAAHGVSRRMLARAHGRGFVVRGAQGVYVVGGSPPTWVQQLWVAHLVVGPESAVAGRSAARLHGINGFRRAGVEIITRQGSAHRLGSGRLHRTFWLPEAHIVVVDGLRCLSVPRLVFELAGDPVVPRSLHNPAVFEAHKAWTRRLFDRAMARHGLTVAAEVQVVAALGRRGKPGTAIMRDLLAEVCRGYVPTESDLERAYVDAVAARGDEQPERQVDLSDEFGWIGRVDFLHRPRRTVVEVDGPDHDTPWQQRLDAARDARLRAAGYEVVRIHWSEIPAGMDEALGRVRAALRRSDAA